ncbi:polysaccharide biosynthesis C-terminal domain-containing protein [Luteimonas sp. SX5]|uniref:Polysaccharide biosynthesis C-terminal domain-containing protein n=1 Tax=Luteimonas galliterrae TaxID=2940486 RepID=A0ABT0MJ27_9GAMM|nr:polysaccharide biosynthesis C-terminal domain-containing protein [Luteimonas galliterrae]MCL1634892.1 polysaccharide biosynthesis C-terminal domain-containing protein [Luteimonas galliterrae]
MTAWRRAAMTVSMLGVATAVGALMVFLTQALLARQMGPNAYGLFASSLATVTMIAPLAGFGLTQFHLKVYGVEGWQARRWLKPSMAFILATTLAALAVVVAWALTGAPHDGTRFSLLVLVPVVLSVLAVNLVSNKYRLENRFGRMALNQMVIPGSRLLAAIALLVVPRPSGELVALCYGAISLLVALSAIPQMRAMFSGEISLVGYGPRSESEAPAAASPGMGAVWSEAWAYGVYAALYPVFFQISTILLKYLQGDSHAGMYAIALAVMTAIYLIPATIYQKFLQGKLHRWAAHDKPKFQLVYRKGNVAMFLLGLAVSAALVLLGPWLVPLVFGERYQRVVAILMVLAFCPPIRFLSTSMGSALLTENHMRFRVYAMAFATVAAVAGNALVIPAYGDLGAAWATVAAETILLLGTYYGVRRFTRIQRAGDDSDRG